VLQPISPLVAGRKNERGHYDYRSPEDADFVDCLLYNWLEKWGSVHDASDADMALLREAISIQIRLLNHPPQQRLITIKAGTPGETKVKGYMKFKMAVKAPGALLELALGAGLGLHNAQGFGCVGGDFRGVWEEE
jgi:CRISPR-associated endoribonuclease Cas6